jgi:hypothetical protein
VIEVGLGFFQTVEAQAFQRCSLGVTDARFDLAFAVRILDAAGHGHRAVVREHIAIEGIESGIVNVGDEHALTQIIEHDDASGAAEPAKGSFVQFGPDSRTGPCRAANPEFSSERTEKGPVSARCASSFVLRQNGLDSGAAWRRHRRSRIVMEIA